MKHTHILFALALVVPASMHAATLDASDTVAGLATEIIIQGVTPNTDVPVTLTSPLGASTAYTLHAGNEGIAHTWIAGNDLQEAGTYHIQALQNIQTLVVHPDTLDTQMSFIDVTQSTVKIGQEVRATVVLTDRYGNPLSGRAVQLISNRSSDIVEALAGETDSYGELDFIVRASTEGQMSLRAIDLISGETLADTVHIAAGTTAVAMGGPQFYRAAPNPFRAQVFEQEAPQFAGIDIIIEGQEDVQTPRMQTGKAASIMLQAVDQYGNPFRDFVGNVYLATTDPEAELPLFGSYDFSFSDEGQKILTLGLTFRTPGLQTMILTDDPNVIPDDVSQALGALDIEVVTGSTYSSANQKIIINAPQTNTTLGAQDLMEGNRILVQGQGREFINITITGDGITDTAGETDREGNFAVSVPIDTSKSTFSLKVIDDDAQQNNSEPLPFSIDVTAPEQTITIAPEKPVEGSDVLIVVQTEPSVQEVYMTIGEQRLDMATSDISSGKYQYLLNVAEPGDLPVTIVTTDSFGNTTEETISIPVKPKDLPKVEGLVAEGQINAVALNWNPVEDFDVTGYRIYVGTEPGNFIYTLDTQGQETAATVAGLQPGTEYHFAVSALQAERESINPSDIAAAIALGVTLQTTPGDGSVVVEWNTLDPSIRLSSFILSYGIDEENLSEERTLHSDLRRYIVKDLMNGKTYYFKLTPITVTGEVREELAATGTATPNGKKYTAGTSDPVPYDLRTEGGPLHSSAPVTNPPYEMPLSEEGLPAWMIVGILIVSAYGYRVYLRRKRAPAVTHMVFDAINHR